jgi:hypothetical protein
MASPFQGTIRRECLIKSVDGVDLVITAAGGISVPSLTRWAKQKVAEAIGRAGWKDEAWHQCLRNGQPPAFWIGRNLTEA